MNILNLPDKRLIALIF